MQQEGTYNCGTWRNWHFELRFTHRLLQISLHPLHNSLKSVLGQAKYIQNQGDLLAEQCWNCKPVSGMCPTIGVYGQACRDIALRPRKTILGSLSQQERPFSFDGQNKNHTFNQPSEALRLKIWLTNYSSPGALAQILKARIVRFFHSWISSPGVVSAWLALDHSPSETCIHTHQHSAKSHQVFPHGSTSWNGRFNATHSEPSQLTSQIKQQLGPPNQTSFQA